MKDVVRQEIAATAGTIVVKLGSRVLTREDGLLDRDQIARLADQIHAAEKAGRKVVVVSSGAVAAGMGRLGLKRRPTNLAELQAVAAIGQSVLLEAYEAALGRHGRHAGQVLLTAEDLQDRRRYLNARNTILTMLRLGAVPVINENDTVAVDELQTSFGDNDRLAALVTNLIRAPLLVLLSDVAGLYDGNPEDPSSRRIKTVERLDDSIFALVRDKKSGLSKGGMASKLTAAGIVAVAGENVIIASGHEANILSQILAGEPVGTLILAQGSTVTSRKRWIGFTVRPRGKLLLDAGARKAVSTDGRSLLAIGIVGTTGRFRKGDVVTLCTADGIEFGRGLTNYDVEDIEKIKGLKTDKIGQVLGQCPYDEVVHRDNMVVTRILAE